VLFSFSSKEVVMIKLFSFLRRPIGRLDAELLCVFRVQSLPIELHGLGADDASNRLTRNETIQNIEADVPPGSTHGDEAVTDVGPEREARAANDGRCA
jgi:hypothetical protein